MGTMRQSLDKIATSILRYILPLTAFLVPLFFLPITPNFFDYNKTYLIYVLASVSLIAWTVRTIARRRIHLTITPSTMALVLLSLVFIASSLIQSPIRGTSLLGKTSLFISLTIIFLSVTSTQKNENIITTTIYSLIGSTVALSIFSLLHYLGLLQSLINLELLSDKTFNPSGGILPYLTLSLALIPGMIYFGIKEKSTVTKVLLFIASAITVTASISQINLIITSGSQFVWPFLPFSAGWSISIDIFKDIRTALLGTGPETFLSTFTRLRPASLNLTPVWNVRFTNSSNEFFNILTTTGILGGFFWLSSLIRPISTAFRNKAALTSNPSHTFSLITLLMAFLLSLITPANMILVTLILVSLCLVNLSLKLDSDTATRDVTLNLLATSTHQPNRDYDVLITEKSSANQVLVWLFALPSLIILAVFWAYSSRAYAASLATYKALSTINTNATESYNQQVKAYTLDPRNPVYRLNFAQTSLALANSLASKTDLTDQDKNNITQLVSQSIREAKNATQLYPQSVVNWENLANTYRQLINFADGSADWAVASYNQAILLDPTNPSLRLDLGGLYFAFKDYDRAIQVFNQAAELKNDWANIHYNLAAAYKANNNLQKALSEMRIVVQLIDPNSEDYQKAQDELSELEKQVQTTTSPDASNPDTTQNDDNIELVTPTPIPSPTGEKIPLPNDAGPVIPSPTPTETVTPTPTAETPPQP